MVKDDLMDEKILQHNFDRVFDKLDRLATESTESKKDIEYIKKEMTEKNNDRKKIWAVAVTSGIALFGTLLNFFKGG